MARYQITLAYDGTDFYGFQRQGSDRTVQLAVETVLKRIGWKGLSILAAGRTDRGVHATGQVISVDFDWAHSTLALKNALNAYLPDDVAVQCVEETQTDFHPRFDALSRTYRYHIYCQPARNPLMDRFAWRVWPEVDFSILQEAASLFPGSHDFSVFGGPMKPGGTTIREVLKAEWTKKENDLWFEIQANAFLYHMVRRIVFLQIQAAYKKISLMDLQKGVESSSPLVQGLAPPQGLTLDKVTYPLIEQQEKCAHIKDSSKS